MTQDTQVEAPAIGTGMTLLYPQDRYPFVVVARSESGKTLTVAEIDVDTRSRQPDRRHGPWPVYDIWLTEEEIATLPRLGTRKVRLRKDGRYWDRHTPFSVGIARYYRDYSD